MENRSQAATEIAQIGGALALEYYRRMDTLKIEDKGPQDFVSEADKAVEAHIRNLITAAFPDDGIVGEEEEEKPSSSGYTWIIDPIDGTTNFISEIPAWTVVIAVVFEDQTHIGVIYDPIHKEMYLARRECGATLNGKPLICAADRTLTRGSIGTGFSKRTPVDQTVAMIGRLMDRGGVYYRNASGALALAYVAAGRLNGYIEGHMNAWDCLAGQLLVAEAGGAVEPQSAKEMIASGGRVVAGSKGVFDELVEIANASYAD